MAANMLVLNLTLLDTSNMMKCISLAAPNPTTLKKKGLGKLNTKKSSSWNAISDVFVS